MNIIKSIMTKNPCYTSGRKISVKGLMLHSVGCPQPSAEVFINNWNKATYKSACVHGFIDADTGEVYQTLPWNYRGWHGGRGKNGSCNNTHIGIEMCEPSSIKYTSGSNFTCSDTARAKADVKRTYDSAVELFAFLCKEYSLNPLEDGVIISHREGSSRGIATNHSDPEHLWTGLNTGYTMDKFRNDVKSAMDSMEEYTDINAIVWELKHRGIVEDGDGMVSEMTGEPNGRLYHLGRKLCHAVRRLYDKGVSVNVSEYKGIDEIVWDLHYRGIVEDRSGLIDELNAKPNGRLYWLARKGLHYLRCRD